MGAFTLKKMPVEARGPVPRNSTTRLRTRLSYNSWVDLGAVPATREGYNVIFLVGAWFTALVAVSVLLIPESRIYFGSRQSATIVEQSVRVLKDLSLLLVYIGRCSSTACC